MLVDRMAGHEVRLYSREAQAELERCRQLLQDLPGVHIDPGYRAILRAYRYAARQWLGIAREDVEAVLRAGQFEHIKVTHGPADTLFVPKLIDKGSGLLALRERLPQAAELTAAVGDSAQDLPMLRLADRAYVPANGSGVLKRAARSLPQARIMKRAMQRGLLEAVVHLLRTENGLQPSTLASIQAELVRPSTHPVDAALEAFEQPALHRLIRVLTSTAGA
jgi:hypothetical protein